MRNALYILVVFSQFIGGSLYSQQGLPITQGERIRVTAPQCRVDRLVTTFEAYGNSALMLPRRYCPLESVTRLEVIRSQQRQTLPGLRSGLLSGLGLGVFTGVVFCAVEKCGEYAGCIVTATTVIGAGAGLVLGGVVGSLIKTDRWEEVPLDRLRVSLAPKRGGRFAVGVTLRF